MSFSHYKVLLRIAQFSSIHKKCNYKIVLRPYSGEAIFSSPSPHEFKKPEVLNNKKESNYRQEILSNNHTVAKDLQYLNERESHEKEVYGRNHWKFKSSKIDSKDSEDSLSNNENETKVSKYKFVDNDVTFDLSKDEFCTQKYNKEINESISGLLDECKEDLSYFGPAFSPTYNFAAYADKSELIQQFIKLGVKLYKVEKNPDHMRALLSVDLEKELPMYIQFLHDCGVPADCLGDVITDNPIILTEDMDDLKTRIRYLRAHKFARESIARIVTKNPTWLTWATKCIDERLGHFQNEFKLSGSDIRFLATKQPKLITYNMKNIHENTFSVREEMGFNPNEVKILLLNKPRVWMSSRKKNVESFNYLHYVMNLPHQMIVSQADVLTCRKNRLQSRHEFLVELKKAQYDPKKPGYIAPQSVAFGSDADFCRDVAKTAVETYNLFLKTH